MRKIELRPPLVAMASQTNATFLIASFHHLAVDFHATSVPGERRFIKQCKQVPKQASIK